jgi:hypothetical protein
MVVVEEIRNSGTALAQIATFVMRGSDSLALTEILLAGDGRYSTGLLLFL